MWSTAIVCDWPGHLATVTVVLWLRYRLSLGAADRRQRGQNPVRHAGASTSSLRNQDRRGLAMIETIIQQSSHQTVAS